MDPMTFTLSVVTDMGNQEHDSEWLFLRINRQSRVKLGDRRGIWGRPLVWKIQRAVSEGDFQ